MKHMFYDNILVMLKKIPDFEGFTNIVSFDSMMSFHFWISTLKVLGFLTYAVTLKPDYVMEHENSAIFMEQK